MILFVIPLILTGILQLFYNMADHAIVGKFSGDEYALAAVGASASLSALIVNILIGISTGTAVVVAQGVGAKNNELIKKTVHTSITFALVSGIAVGVIGFFVSKPILVLMGTNELFIDKSTLYMQIICLGIPASAVYNFAASTLRSVGDSSTPLTILLSCGIINVLLNVFFVLSCGMTVDGVALATIISQYVSALAAVFVLMKRKGEAYAFSLKNMRIELPVLLRILKFGIPASIQTSLFSISNVVITSAINTLPPNVLTGKTIAANIDGVIDTCIAAYSSASVTFVAQNYGARNLQRVRESIKASLIQVITLGLFVGGLVIVLGRYAAMLFIDPADPNKEEVLEIAMSIIRLMAPLYFTVGIMHTLSGAIRGIGHPLSPTIITIVGVCGLRIVWILLFFPIEVLHNILGIYLCYPITWCITSIALAAVLITKLGKLKESF